MAAMSHLFAAILLFSSPGCPHEEPTCITPTEYVKVNFSSTARIVDDMAAGDGNTNGLYDAYAPYLRVERNRSPL
jgi:hypothetical protein